MLMRAFWTEAAGERYRTRKRRAPGLGVDESSER